MKLLFSPENNLTDQGKTLLSSMESLFKMMPDLHNVQAYGLAPGESLSAFKNMGTLGQVVTLTAAFAVVVFLCLLCCRVCGRSNHSESRPLLPS